MDLRGDRALIKALDKLPAAMVRRVVRPGARKAIVPVNKDAKNRAKRVKRTGQLWRSIGIKQKSYTRRGVIWTAVGARSGYRINTHEFGWVDPRKYSHLVEFGFMHRRGKVSARFVRPQPFLRPAFDGKRSQMKSILTAEVRKGIPREVEKARRKAAGKK
jgi:HK97 gp10 family phage protein